MVEGVEVDLFSPAGRLQDVWLFRDPMDFEVRRGRLAGQAGRLGGSQGAAGWRVMPAHEVLAADRWSAAASHVLAPTTLQLLPLLTPGGAPPVPRRAPQRKMLQQVLQEGAKGAQP